MICTTYSAEMRMAIQEMTRQTRAPTSVAHQIRRQKRSLGVYSTGTELARS